MFPLLSEKKNLNMSLHTVFHAPQCGEHIFSLKSYYLYSYIQLAFVETSLMHIFSLGHVAQCCELTFLNKQLS